MKNFWFKGYYVMMNKNQHSGSVEVIADNEVDRIKRTFYFFEPAMIITNIKNEIRRRVAH